MPTYKIDLNDEDRLNAIIKYNQKIKITGIEYDGITQDLSNADDENTGKNLLVLLTEAKESNARFIEISYTTCGAETLFSIFPKVDLVHEDYELSPAQEAIIDQYSSLFSRQRYDMNLLGSNERLLPPITAEATAIAIRILAGRTEVSGALHLPYIHTILFESEGSCYSVVYGEHPSVELVKGITFNIDYGFNFRQLYTDYEFVIDLNDYFASWLKGNYKEILFPDSAGIQNIASLKSESNIISDAHQSFKMK